jgi:hypothetical protein
MDHLPQLDIGNELEQKNGALDRPQRVERLIEAVFF